MDISGRQKGLKFGLLESWKKSMRGKRDRRSRSLGRKWSLQGAMVRFSGGLEVTALEEEESGAEDFRFCCFCFSFS